MAAKRKTKKKQTKSKKTTKNLTSAKKSARRKASAKKKAARKRPVQKKAAVKTKTFTKKAAGKKKVSAVRSQARDNDQIVDTARFSLGNSRARSAGQSGDLQGLSSVEGADSESVDELLEEGNAFEADVVTGVEDAGDAGEKEVRTHEVPEDDVPGEYLDKER
jgi:hypothetical protein